MFRSMSLSVIVLGLAYVSSANAVDETAAATAATTDDPRQLVTMPDAARKLMREDMLDHLSAMNEIIGLLAENKLDAAAEVAETRMGESSKGKHRGSGMGPGRFMTEEMRSLGWGMHAAASEFSAVAKKGELKNALAALQQVNTACVSCHYSYRTR